MKPLLLCTLMLLISSPLGAQRAKRGCPDITADSATGGVAAYLACQVDREAKPRGIAPRFDWTPSSSELRDGACFRAEFQFVVDTLGIPDIATVRDAGATNANFQQAMRDAIPRLRYSPAMLKGSPVPQLVTYKQSVAIRTMVSSSPSSRPTPSRPPRC
ncbi:MAG: hypothetical protein ACYC3F_16175 [Gemmatimonadaceae bacterium]